MTQPGTPAGGRGGDQPGGRGLFGLDPRQLDDAALERELRHLYATREETFFHGTRQALLNHTERVLQLERQYARRFPERTKADALRTRKGLTMSFLGRLFQRRLLVGNDYGGFSTYRDTVDDGRPRHADGESAGRSASLTFWSLSPALPWFELLPPRPPGGHHARHHRSAAARPRLRPPPTTRLVVAPGGLGGPGSPAGPSEGSLVAEDGGFPVDVFVHDEQPKPTSAPSPTSDPPGTDPQ